jgi:hypothetical protein
VNHQKQQSANQSNFIAEKGPAKLAAEKYLGREMSDAEWNQLIRATFAEAGRNQTERAYVMATILNRARNDKKSVTQILYQKNQFQAVTGTAKNGRRSSINYITGPNPANAKSIYGAATDILPDIPKNIINFTAANSNAYGPGTNIRYRDTLLARGGKQIGETIFSS